MTGLPVSVKVEVVGAKAGCVVSSLDAAGIGLLPLEAGAISISTLSVTDLPSGT